MGYHGIAVLQSRNMLIVFGGNGCKPKHAIDSTCYGLKSAELYDIERREWISGPSMNVGRAELGYTTIHGNVLAVGGQMIRSKLDSSELLNHRTLTWHHHPSKLRRLKSYLSCGTQKVNTFETAVCVGGWTGSFAVA